MFRVESTDGSNPFSEQFRIHRYWLQLGFVFGAIFAFSIMAFLLNAKGNWFKVTNLNPAPTYGASPPNSAMPANVLFSDPAEPNEAAMPNDPAEPNDPARL